MTALISSNMSKILKKIIPIFLICALMITLCVGVAGCKESEDNVDNNVTTDIPSDGATDDGESNTDINNGETNGGGSEEDQTMNIAKFVITDQNGVDRTVKIQLHPEKAPISVENFTRLANNGYYDGLVFHRIVPGGCLQGGGYKIEGQYIMEAPDTASIYGEFASNGWTKNDLQHVFGTISMARTSVKNSATSQFFLCIGSYPSWDGEYAAFGTIVDEKESKDNLTILGQSTYTAIDYMFQTFPYPILTIKSVRVD